MFFKYIHIFWANELKFSIPCLEMVRNSFNPSEHGFVTNSEELYKSISKYDNVFYISEKNLFNAVGDCCDWIISHDYPSFFISLSTKRRIKKKIVFRYWGGRRTFPKSKSFFKTVANVFLKSFYKFLFKMKYSYIPFVGIANVVDRIDLQGLIKDEKMFLLPYARRITESMIVANSSTRKDHLNVVVGHRSDPTEHHIRYIEMLESLPEEKISIFIPLSYGDLNYAEKIKAIIDERQYSNITIVEEMMSYEDYCSFLSRMDIAIIDCLNSLALGNVQLLVSMSKTIYLNNDGVIAKAFVSENIPFYSLDRLNNISFNQLNELLSYDSASSELRKKTYEEQIECWKQLFLLLNKQNEA